MTQLVTKSLDATILSFFGAGLVLLAIFVVIELRHPEPMVNLRIFRVPTMTPSLLASLFQALGNYAVLFLVIMYLQGPRGLSALDASLLLVPGYLLGGAIGPVAGRVADRVGPAVPATIGLLVQVAALFLYAHLTNDATLALVVLASIVNGIGGSSFFPANNSAVMKAAPPEVFGIASGMLRTFSNIGMVFSFAIAILSAARSIPRGLAFAIFVGTTKLQGHLADVFTKGLHGAFYTSMAFLVVAAIFSLMRGRRRSPGAKAPATSVAAQ